MIRPSNCNPKKLTRLLFLSRVITHLKNLRLFMIKYSIKNLLKKSATPLQKIFFFFFFESDLCIYLIFLDDLYRPFNKF